jgi:hypothetical protein
MSNRLRALNLFRGRSGGVAYLGSDVASRGRHVTRGSFVTVQCCGCPVLAREEPITCRESWLAGIRRREVAGFRGSVSIVGSRGTRRRLTTVEYCGRPVLGRGLSVPCRAFYLTGTRGRRVAGLCSFVPSRGRFVSSSSCL